MSLVSQKVHPSSYARSSRARRSGSGMGAVNRDPGKPIPMVPKPIRGTRGPFLPNGRSTGEGDVMIWPCVGGELREQLMMEKGLWLSCKCALAHVKDMDRGWLLRGRCAYLYSCSVPLTCTRSSRSQSKSAQSQTLDSLRGKRADFGKHQLRQPLNHSRSCRWTSACHLIRWYSLRR
jgi:hypothetical protein